MPIEIQRLQDLFRKSGKTYSDLSRETGIPKSALQRYITGATEKIPIDRLEKIVISLGSSTKEILGWSSSDKTDNNKSQALIIMQALHENPRLGLLFDKSKNMKQKDLDVVLDVVDAIMKERDGDD